MDSLSVTCIAVGILIIAMRAPLIFAPRAALRFYDRVIFSTNVRCRAFSVVIAIVAVTLLLLPFDNGPLAGFLYVAGCGGRGRLHVGATKYLSGILALDVQLRRELSASSIRARPGRPWRVGRSRPDLRRGLRRLISPYFDAAHPREP